MYAEFRSEREAHWEAVAEKLADWTGWGDYYQRRLAQLYRHLVTPGLRVLEIGCGEGDLLAAVEPESGVGIDFSEGMLARARERHGDLRFVCADAHDFSLDETFDVVILSDLVNDLVDVQTVLEHVRKVCTARTRLIINNYSQLWRPVLSSARKLGLAKPLLTQNWFTVEDTRHLLHLTDFETIRSWPEILLPLPVPLLASTANRFLVKLWPFKFGAMTNFVLARPAPQVAERKKDRSVSVVVAARNEAGNIANILSGVPEMGSGTEIVFVEGGSEDDTYEVIQELIADEPEGRCSLYRQEGVGKGDAVRMGFRHASGDILMILDADLTVPPEDLPRFYDALVSGKAEFVNGVRLVYPMEDRAMRYCNLLGNKFFSLAFSWLLGQPLKDTLCGTKVLWKSDYEKIAQNRSCFGDFDPFGDFDLIFGAAKLGLRIVDLPVRYRERIYGDTNIQRWRHGLILLRMLVFAARRLKFV